MYKVKEIDSDIAEDRKAGDMLFVHELCNDVLKVEVGSGDIEMMFRLGRREQGKERPLLVRFTRSEKKHEVMGKLKGTLRHRLSYGYFSFIAKYASN